MNQRPSALTILQHLFDDRHGLAAGDQVTKSVANAARLAVHEVDLAGRIGGEGFAILLPEAAPEHAVVTAQRVCQNIAQMGLVYEGRTICFTASLGVTQAVDTDRDFDGVLRRSDQMTRAAKGAGRNRVASTA